MMNGENTDTKHNTAAGSKLKSTSCTCNNNNYDNSKNDDNIHNNKYNNYNRK